MLRISVTLLLYLFPITVNASAQQSPTNPAPASGALSKQSAISSPEGFHEDLKSITLEGSALLPKKPILLEKTEILNGKYVRERIQVGWRPRDTFDLYVALPKGTKKPPVILYLYSFPENATRFQSEQWYQGVAKDGYAAVGFVSALTAERAEHRAPDEWFVSLLQESLASSVHDVQMILDYLNSRGDLDMDRVGMFGTGSGATIAILASAADPRIKAIDTFNPWGDWRDWMAKSWIIPEDERGFDLLKNKYVDPKFLEIVAPLDPVRWLPKVTAENLRIQYVQSEATVPRETQKKIEEAAPDRAEINQFSDYRVWMSMEHGPEIFGWLRQELQPDAKPKIASDKAKRVHFFPPAGQSQEPTSAHP
jgi:hypothetical protein